MRRALILPAISVAFALKLGFAVSIVSLVGCNRDSNHPAVKAESDDRRGIMLLRYAPGSESTEQREQGFLDTLEKEFPEIRILSSDQYAGATREKALDVAQQLIPKYRDRLDGIFAVNESAAAGTLEALKQADLAGKITFIGFDSSSRMVEALEQNKMQGLVLQDPVNMGYLAVKTLVDHLEGKPVEKRVSTGELVATPDNMKEAKVAARLSPEQFSGSAAQPTAVKYRIAVIPKGTTHEFWKSVHFGADKAAQELGNVEVIWQGPQNEDEKDGQIRVVENFITRKVDGICLAPLDSHALGESVRSAKKNNIPTVIFDSGLADDSAYVSYVATDNYNGGVLAARRLAEVLKAKPTKN